jgi:succinoglycan biosynthesis transport protein ExoP
MTPSSYPVPTSPNTNALGRACPVELPPPIDEGMVHDVLAILRRQWRLIALTVLVTLGATAAYCELATPWYTATATVLIDSRSPQLLNGQRVEDDQDVLTSAKYDYYQTQFALLVSPSLSARVIDGLALAHDPRFVPPGQPSTPLPPGADPTLLLVQQYLRLLDVLPVRGTRLVTVAFTARDARLAAQVANTHTHLFLRRGVERVDQSIEQMRTFLQTKLADLQDRMQLAETKLLKYQSAHKLLPVDLTQGVENERFTDLSRRLTAAEADRIALDAQYQLIARHDYDGLPAVLASPLIQKLREDMNRLEVDYALMAKKFRPSYPPLAQLAGQVETARALLRRETDKVVAGIVANHLAAAQTVRDLRRSLDGERRVLLEHKDTEGELLRLTRDAETTRALHDNVLARVKELDVTGGADTSNMSVAEPAVPPVWPSSPATRLDLLLSFATGLVLGTGLAFLRDSWERTLRDMQDVCRATGLETLAIIPDFKAGPRAVHEQLRWRAGRARTVASNGLRRIRAATATETSTSTALPLVPLPTSPSAEAYQTLRTALLLSRGSTHPRVLLVTSAAAREGKTTTAVNAALALASCGATVLLIDGDLRLPRCHEALRTAGLPGLTEYLSGRIVSHPIQSTANRNLSFIAAGGAVANPTELLTSWRLSVLLRAMRKQFDYVVIDSPPVLAVSDGLLLANAVDGVLLVAESQRSAADRVQLAVRRLNQAGARVLGAVLNRGEVEREYYRYQYQRSRNGTDDSSPIPPADTLAPEPA